MQVVSPDDVDTVEAEDGVFPSQLLRGSQMNVQHFRFEPGATSSEHSHPSEQVGFVHRGTLTMLVDGEEYEVSAGETLLIPGDVPHAAENRGDEPVEGIDVFSPPRSGTPWDE